MKKFTQTLIVLITFLSLNLKAQDTKVLNEKLTGLGDVVTGINERLAVTEADMAKLNKIKVSGYIQAQYQHFGSLSTQPDNYFSIRRARVKFTYEMPEGIKFVLQPDFSPGSLSLKDAYAVVNEPWTKAFSLWMGKFNRPNYEVEYSSSQRELTERSLVIRTLYPGERAIGAKLEFNPLSLPLHVQIALLNGSESLTIKDASGTNLNSTENKDYDNFKDIMARATFNIKLGNFGGLDLGGHGYFGSTKSIALKTLASDYTTLSDIKYGDPVKRSWFGAEFQLFADFLGGTSLKGEYIAGKNATTGYSPVAAAGTTAAKAGYPNYINNFSGYYLYFIKNLGKKNQFAFRYDYYDPNTDLKGQDVGVKNFVSTDTQVASVKSTKADLATSTFGFALHHYFDDNIRITLDYDIVQNEKVGSEGLITEDYTKADGVKVVKGIDWGKAVNQNVLTLRIQAKF
jgi:hypothetical protein